MGDPTKFRSPWEYYAFHIVFACLLLSELFIFFYTRQRNPHAQTAKRDHGTKWLLYGNFAVCLLISVCSVSRAAPALMRQMTHAPLPQAAQLNLRLLPLIRALFAEVNPIPVKAAAAILGLCENNVRLPLVAMRPEETGGLRELLAELAC